MHRLARLANRLLRAADDRLAFADPIGADAPFPHPRHDCPTRGIVLTIGAARVRRVGVDTGPTVPADATGVLLCSDCGVVGFDRAEPLTLAV